MPVKPHAEPEAFEGGTRMLLGGRALRGAKREIVFDAHGALVRSGAYDGDWPPRWISRVV